MEPNRDLNPSLIIHSTEMEKVEIKSPFFDGDRMILTVNLPSKYDHRDFKFMPYGNSFEIVFQDTTIYKNKIQGWICPDTVIAKYEKNGHILYIEAKIFDYHFNIQDIP